MQINPILEKISKWLCLGSTEQCYLVMYTMVRVFQVKKILEIGTHQGASSITFCQAILDNNYKPEIWTVDSWEGFEGNEQSKNLRSRAEKHFEESGFKKYITMIEGDSKKVVPNILKKIKKVDLCFIDGDHSYEGVIADFNNCKNYTDLILFHDTPNESVPYLEVVKNEGWNVFTFPTRYIEGDAHLVGLSLAKRKD